MNFKKRDEVVCIDNTGGYEKYLTIGKTYEICCIYKGKITNLDHFRILSDAKHVLFVNPLGTMFLSPNEFERKERKDKLNRLNLV